MYTGLWSVLYIVSIMLLCWAHTHPYPGDMNHLIFAGIASVNMSPALPEVGHQQQRSPVWGRGTPLSLSLIHI